MDGFFSTTPGLMLIIAAQSLLVIGFVMISLLFLVYGDRKIWAAVQMRRVPTWWAPSACCRRWPTR
jgi:NADH-quinone oxidoreductase subunit H